MKFRVKDMDIASGGILIAVLNFKDAQKLDLHSGDRIQLTAGKRKTTCILDISKSDKAVPQGKLGLYEEVLEKLHLKNNNPVSLKINGKPKSVIHIREKLYGKRLNYKEMYHIIDDITNDRLTSIEKTYFVSAGFTHGWSFDEVVSMTKAMVNTGSKLKFKGVTLDKHCIGGVPGNRTTMIVVPIVAAAGFIIPKTSSRAITSPAGTADTMECLAKVELPEKKIKKIVKNIGACIVHGGSMNLAPADDKIIEVEAPLSIDAEGQLLASVMAKKFSVSANHVLIDIPMGPEVKVRNKKEAKRLKKKFQTLGKALKMDVKVVITDGTQPIGNGIGPLLESEDVMAVLRNDPLAPQDLKEKALDLAGILLGMCDQCSLRKGRKIAKHLLENGEALKMMKNIIKAQGKVKKPFLGKYRRIVRAGKTGKVKSIQNKYLARTARIAGAPKDKGAGIYMEKKVGDRVRKGEKIYTIYSHSDEKLAFAVEFMKNHNPYVIN
jgi:putative thymidine phosphorylase